MRLMIFVKPFQLFRLKGFVQGERLFYQFVGSVAYVNRNNVRRTLQEKLYELCSPSEDQE